MIRFVPPKKKKIATEQALPDESMLSRNQPNPFNSTVSIGFTLPFSTNWSLKGYNVAGQLIKSFEGFSDGQVNVNWDGTDNSGDKVRSGIYFYGLTVGDFIATKRMVLIK